MEDKIIGMSVRAKAKLKILSILRGKERAVKIGFQSIFYGETMSLQLRKVFNFYLIKQ